MLHYRDIKVGDIVLLNWKSFKSIRWDYWSFSQNNLFDALERNDCAFVVKTIDKDEGTAELQVHFKRQHSAKALRFITPLPYLHKLYKENE